MSFVKKAIKKVVKTVKKIVKSDIFKWVVIAAAIVFTAGVAAGGFAAFAGVNTVGGFFTAVGQTIATGAASIAGGLGFQGASGTLASYGGAAAEAAGLTAGTGIANAAGVTLNAAAGAGGSVTTTAAGTVVSTTGAAAGQAAGSGFLASVKGVMGKKILGDLTIGQMAASGITTAINESLKAKGNEDRIKNTYVAGGLAFGGPSEAPPAPSFAGGESPETEAPPTAPGTEAGPEGEQPSVAAQLAQGEEAQASPASRIQALIQQRGPIGQPGYAGTEQYAGVGGGLAPQGPAAPSLMVQRPEMTQPAGRTFMDQASQLQYAPRGLV